MLISCLRQCSRLRNGYIWSDKNNCYCEGCPSSLLPIRRWLTISSPFSILMDELSDNVDKSCIILVKFLDLEVCDV